MEAVVVSGPILQQQRSRSLLPGFMAPANERLVLFGIANLNAHRLVPAIPEREQSRVELCSQALHDLRQWVGEILVLTPSKPVPAHDDSASKSLLVRVQLRNGRTIISRKHALQNR